MKTMVDGTKIRFDFGTDLDELVFDSATVHSGLHAQAEMYGWNARLTRAAALPGKDSAGNPRTVTEKMKRDAVETMIRHYVGGSPDWDMRPAKVAPQSPVILAIAAKRGITYAEAEILIADLAGL